MNRGAFHTVANSILPLIVILALSQLFAVSQSSTRKKPKLKDFGSSLKRLKWDPERNVAVRSSQKQDSGEALNNGDVVRVQTSLVISDVLVLNKRGESVQGLTEKDFVLHEDGKLQQVAMFSRGDNTEVPRSIVLIFDYGCSQLSFLEASIEAAKTLVDNLTPSDRMAIVTDDVELLVGFTQEKKELKSKLDELKARVRPQLALLPQRMSSPVPFGRGFQYSALMAVLKEAFDDEDERPIVIMQTDGSEAFILRNPTVTPFVPPGLLPDVKNKEEWYRTHFQEYQRRNPREFSLNDVYKVAGTSRATIYTVVPGFRLIGLSPEEQLAQTRAYLMREISYLGNASFRQRLVDRVNRMPVEDLRLEATKRAKLQSDLAVLSTVTGGWLNFFDQPSQAADIYSRIFSDINRRYILGYYPTNKERDGKRRKVSIEVRGHPEYMLIGRKGYYVLDPEQ